MGLSHESIMFGGCNKVVFKSRDGLPKWWLLGQAYEMGYLSDDS